MKRIPRERKTATLAKSRSPYNMTVAAVAKGKEYPTRPSITGIIRLKQRETDPGSAAFSRIYSAVFVE
ncbi:hypothetical protein Q0A17_18650 [Citrobacter sp. S2-9]|uniref:Uncharacterized protein n=1 Tax=Citrobacter enshiensis TaxID=2971264 RepID=A0ABT8Q1F4_9ENTR|nr:hypothetical protein [Citrobacter enshiensis]MDN8601414.1 hypothetical protein [Citrobacter enshiensis]